MTFTSKPNKLLRALLLSSVLLSQSCNIEPLPESSHQELNQESVLGNQLRPLQADEFRFFDQVLKIPEGLFRWEAQLNKLIESNSFYNNLELLDYKFVKDVASVDDLDLIKSELVNNFNLIPIEKKGSFGEYELSDNVFSPNDFSCALNFLFPTSEAMLRLAKKDKDNSSDAFDFYKFQKDDLSAVELKWSYNGDVLKTLCLVSSEKGCVFDSFLNFIDHPKKENGSENLKISSAVSRMQNFGGETGVIIYPLIYEQELYNTDYDFNGNRKWWYTIKYEMIGELVGSKRTVKDKSVYAVDWASKFYSCDANIATRSFETGEGGHLDVAYGYTYKSGVGANLSWNGFGFTINGGGYGVTAEDYISESEMWTDYGY